MKNQYFGDINDYRKYGLLRILTGKGKIRTAVCWMLTEDDGRSDGEFIDYLQNPERWRHRDPELFDALGECLKQGIRDVGAADTHSVIPSAVYYSRLLTDNGDERRRYFQDFAVVAEGCDLVFFDPDTCMEVKSKPYGRKDSSKYLYWDELRETFNAGHSVLVYQHFPRVERDKFVRELGGEMMHCTGAPEVFSFRTPHVAFFLVSQPHHLGRFLLQGMEAELAWGSEMRLLLYPAHPLAGFKMLASRIHGVYYDAIHGYRLVHARTEAHKSKMREKLEKLKPESPSVDLDKVLYYFTSGTPDADDAEVLHRTKLGEVKERNKEDGANWQFTANMCVVALYQYWEERFRPEIANRHGVEPDQIRSDLMGDLRHLRHSIIHNGEIATDDVKRCKILKWFKPGDRIHITRRMYQQIVEATRDMTYTIEEQGR